MIISASRRTDIPAFYAKWFLNRIQEGYCTVPNPFNHHQVSVVSLKPKDVDAIVFWTRNPRPLLPYLGELEARGFHYYFQYTLMNNPALIDRKSPALTSSLEILKALSNMIGPDRIIWRYDPIVFSNITGLEFHRQNYGLIAQALKGYTKRSVISIVDIYKKAGKRVTEMSKRGIELKTLDTQAIADLMPSLVFAAHANGMEICSCAEDIDLQLYGVCPGKCVDDEYIKKTFGIDVVQKKDPAQREACGCVISRDIGMYDSCLFGCQYCYATSNFELAKANHKKHAPQSPSLIGNILPNRIFIADKKIPLGARGGQGGGQGGRIFILDNSGQG